MTRGTTARGYKKLVLVGPAAAGKTTFKRVFFENANPLKLLDEGLDPTRGIENSKFSFLSNTIGVWDLAGQEMSSWLGKNSNVFQNANVITCMISAVDDLKKNASFLINMLKVKQGIAPGADLFLLLNKCDRVPILNARGTIHNLCDYARVKHPDVSGACLPGAFHFTSVTESYFLKTLNTAFKIIMSCLNKEELHLPASQVQSMTNRMRLLSSHTPGMWFSMADVSYKLSMSLEETRAHLESLHAGGYVMKREKTFYTISERGAFIARAFEQDPEVLDDQGTRGNLAAFMNLYQGRSS